MTSNEIREKFLNFFKSKGHSILPSASLVPVGDSSVLFTTAGMQPLVPYLLGQTHPAGKRLASIQKCVRTGDIDDIGDNRHLTFFEMMGNWSLGDYFKEDSIAWSYEFLTDKNAGLGLDPKRLYVTCFEGDDSAPMDEQSKNIWMKVGIPESRIYFLGKEDNWWGPGDNGPCGPDTEIFYDVTGSLGELSQEDFVDAVKKEKAIEIWNNVFMEYKSLNGKVVGKLDQKNVDTGMGLERITAVVNGLDNVYETDCFSGFIKNLPSNMEEKKKRILADHIRTIAFLIKDGVVPDSKKQGFILRRLLRRLLAQYDMESIKHAVNWIKSKYYEELKDVFVWEVVEEEWRQFIVAINLGMKELNKLDNLDSITAVRLYTSYGLPVDVMKDKFPNFDMQGFQEEFQKHQDLSRSASAGMFKGGLANHNEATIKLHTAHHLLLAALQQVLGSEVKQRGSNITEERLRIDFSFDRKMTEEEKKKVEDIVNDAIKKDLKVVKREMSKEEAEKLGAQMEFGAKYGDTVSVYFIEDENGGAFSKEFCGGPHVTHTGELGHFKIQKEEASSQGVRRIKAILE